MRSAMGAASQLPGPILELFTEWFLMMPSYKIAHMVLLLRTEGLPEHYIFKEMSFDDISS